MSHKAPGERLREVDESSRQLNSAIDRASRFLNLASLASVLLAAVAVAMGARRYAARHIDAVALMKCMGASQGFVLAISSHRIDAAGGVRGGDRRCARAISRSRGWRGCCRDSFAPNCPPASLAPLPIALVTVLAMLIGFALPPLLQLKNTPPARVLRKTRERAAAALRRELSAGARGAVRNSVEPGARHRTGVERAGRRARRRCGADPRRLRAGAADGPACAAASAWPGATGLPMYRAAAPAAWCRSSPSAWG